jgi:hypothetical protein
VWQTLFLDEFFLVGAIQPGHIVLPPLLDKLSKEVPAI